MPPTSSNFFNERSGSQQTFIYKNKRKFVDL